MKILSKILGPKLLKRFSLWYYKTFGAPSSFERGSIYSAMVLSRLVEINGRMFKNVVSGDSVAAGGEPYFELIEETLCTAIPGCRTDTLLARLHVNVLAAQPQTVVLHIGGNDILAGVDLDLIIGNLAQIYKMLKAGGVKRIAWIEILPLGPAFAEQNKAASELNAIVKKQLAFDVLEVRSKLAGPDGFILPKYHGDGIHCNAAAYNDVFYPVVAKYIRGGK